MRYILLGIICIFINFIPVKAQQSNAKFKKMLNTFQVAVRNNNANTMRNLVHFPLPTGIAQQDIGNGAPTDPIDQREFKKYYPSIFHEKAIKLLDKRKYNDIHKVGLANGQYYASLQKTTDRGSQMYELYIQYAEDRSQSESYFSFIFGQISGQYKVIGYYAKWPVKY